MRGIESRRDADSPDGNRAQSPFDFQVGATVFLVAVIFVISFAPSTLDTFEESGQSDTVTADRIVTNLSLDHLAHPSEPYRLDRARTTEFFQDEEYASIDDSLGETKNLNISITGTVDGNSSILCWNDSDRQIDVQSNCSSNTFAGGGNASQQNTVSTARRRISIGEAEGILRVKVW